jgi:cellobiose-specific phosphotransferase system component IIC
LLLFKRKQRILCGSLKVLVFPGQLRNLVIMQQSVLLNLTLAFILNCFVLQCYAFKAFSHQVMFHSIGTIVLLECFHVTYSYQPVRRQEEHKGYCTKICKFLLLDYLPQVVQSLITLTTQVLYSRGTFVAFLY